MTANGAIGTIHAISILSEQSSQRKETKKKNMVKKASLLLTGLAALCLGAVQTAQAQISAIGPFSGSLSETWEGFLNYRNDPNFYLLDPTSIMGGAASISNPQMAVYEPSAASFGLGGSGAAQVSDGAKGMGLDTSQATATITFDCTVDSFGAYWGAATFGSPNAVRLSFFDVFDGLIGNDSFQYDHSANQDGGLDWHGWSSTTPIKKIQYTGDFVVIDGLQAHGLDNCPKVPEPGALAMLAGLGIGGVLILRRKRA